MKIAIPVNEDHKTVCISFGRTPEFLIFDSENNERIFADNSEAANASGGSGVKAAQVIVDNKADILLTPRCGENADTVLKEAQIKIYKTTSDDLEAEIEKFNQGKLDILTEIHAGFHNPDFNISK